MGIVIGITGLAGAGKDTYASALDAALRRRGVFSSVAGFADPLRSISNLVGLDPYTRATKEVKQRIPLTGAVRFPPALCAAIRRCLPDMAAQDRAALGSYTLEACKRFIEMDGDLYISPREFMQLLGTEAGQRVRPTLWVDYQHDAWQARKGVVLVSDFRFYHELPPLVAVVNVARPGTARVNDHRSEDLPDLLTRVLVPAIGGKPVTYVLNDQEISYLLETAELHAAMLIHTYKDSI